MGMGHIPLAKTYIETIVEELYKRYKEKGKHEYSIEELHIIIAKITGFEKKSISNYLRKLDVMGYLRLLPDYKGMIITEQLVNECIEKEKEKALKEEIKKEVEKQGILDKDGLPRY
jgi:hypothetical protein